MDLYTAIVVTFGLIASVFIIMKLKPQKKTNKNNISPAATALGTQTKILKTRMKNLAHEAEILTLEKTIQDMKYELQPEEEEEPQADGSVDTMMMGFLAQLLQKNQAPQGAGSFPDQPTQYPQSDFATAYTPEIKEIRDTVENGAPSDNERLNKLLATARSLPKDQLAKILQNRSEEIAAVLKE